MWNGLPGSRGAPLSAEWLLRLGRTEDIDMCRKCQGVSGMVHVLLQAQCW